MESVLLTSINYSGYSANITFYPLTGGTISLGYHTIPYLYTTNFIYGSYDLYFSSSSVTCNTSISPNLVYMSANTSYNTTFQFTIYGTAININWGDGSPSQTITNSTISHTYTGPPTTYQISFTPILLTQLSVNSGNLTGISELPNTIINLDVGDNHLSYLYLNNLTALQNLNCSQNNITNLNLLYNNNLQYLTANNNSLTEITLPISICLFIVYLNSNNLTSLDLSSQNLITILNCSDNLLTGLTLYNSTDNVLGSLNFSNNNISYFDFEYLQFVTTLNCSGNTLNDLTNINNIPAPNLSTLICDNNNLSSLDVNNLPIGNLTCSHNSLTNLVLSDLQSINVLNCSYNSLTTITNNYWENVATFISNNNLFNTLTVNSFLNAIATNSYNINGTLKIENQLPSPPSGQGLLDIDYLINTQGWSVTYDIPITTIVFNATINPNVSFNIVGDIYNVNWGDGTTASTYSTGVVSHTYSSGGLKTLTFGTQLTLTELHQTNYNNLVSVSNLPPTLTSLTFRSQYLTSLNVPMASSSLLFLDCDSCGLNSSSLDVVLSNFVDLVDTYVLIGGTLILTNQIPLSSPTSGGLDNKDYLINNYSWDVQTD